MTDLRAIRWARGFALLIRPWPPAGKYPRPSRIVMARWLGQLELFPLPKAKPAPCQLRLPLTGGYWWGGLRSGSRPSDFWKSPLNSGAIHRVNSVVTASKFEAREHGMLQPVGDECQMTRI